MIGIDKLRRGAGKGGEILANTTADALGVIAIVATAGREILVDSERTQRLKHEREETKRHEALDNSGIILGLLRSGRRDILDEDNRIKPDIDPN